MIESTFMHGYKLLKLKDAAAVDLAPVHSECVARLTKGTELCINIMTDANVPGMTCRAPFSS